MSKISLVRDVTTNEIFSAVIFDDNRVNGVAIARKSLAWADWVNDSFATFTDVKNVLTSELQQEFAEPITGKTLTKLQSELGSKAFEQVVELLNDDALVQVGQTHKTMGSRYVAKSVQQKTLDPRDLRNVPLSQIPASERQNALNYKARHFRTQQKRSALQIQVKRVRAVFDANIGPGGGWRCPDGTLYGGQITDRFGRGCGGGLTRRIGRALMRAGQGLDQAGAARDSRRMARRARAAAQGQQRRERIRAGRTRIANRLDDAANRLVGDFAPPRSTRRNDRPARRVVTPGEGRPAEDFVRELLSYEILPTGERGKRYSEMSDEELQAALSRNQPARPLEPQPGRPQTIGFRPDNPQEERRKEANRRAIEQEMARRVRGGQQARRPQEAEQRAPRRPGGQAERRPGAQRPAPRRPGGQGERGPGAQQPARPTSRREEGGDPFDFIEDPEKREVVREALGDYAEEIADLIQNRRRGERRRRGEQAGAGPDRPETPEDRPSLIRRILDALARAYRRFQEARENRRQRRTERRENRNARRVMLADRLDEAAQRILGGDGPAIRRRRGADDSEDRRRVNQRAREVADQIVEDGEIDDPEMYRRYREERGIPDDVQRLNDKELEGILNILDDEEREARRDPDGFDPFLFERRRQRRRLRAEMRRRRSEQRNQGRRRREPEAENRPATPTPRTPRTDELDGSRPDERSLRNVRNRFPQRGLPRRAVWRDREREGYNEANEREMDRRFGRYYDDAGNLNDRGRYVNAKLREERARQGRVLSPNERQDVVERADEDFDRRQPTGEQPAQPPVEAPEAERVVRTEDLDGSRPDERSLRNVRNQFRRRGLPPRASWRNRNDRRYNPEREAEMDRRFGRYYDDAGNLNDRGRYVNQKLAEERAAQGGALDEAQADNVIRQANAEYNDRNPVVFADIANIDPNGPDDDDLLARARDGSLEAGFEATVQRLVSDLGGDDENTPDALRDIEDRLGPVLAQQRLLVARLQAHRDGRINLTDEQVSQASEDLDHLRRALRPVFMVDQGRLGARGNPLAGAVGIHDGNTHLLGLMHPRFDGAPRAAFLRAKFGQRAGIDQGLRMRSVDGLRAAIDAADLVNARLPDGLDLENWREWDEDQLVDYVSWAAFRSNNPADFERAFVDATGMSFNQAQTFMQAVDRTDSLVEQRREALQAALSARSIDRFQVHLNRLKTVDENILRQHQLMGSTVGQALPFGRYSAAQQRFYDGLRADMNRRHGTDMPGAVRSYFGDPNFQQGLAAATVLSQLTGRLLSERLSNPAGRIGADRETEDFSRRRLRELKALRAGDRRSLAEFAGLPAEGFGPDREAELAVAASFSRVLRDNPGMRRWLDGQIRDYEQLLNQPANPVPQNERRADDQNRGVVDPLDNTPAAQKIEQLLNETREARRQSVRSSIARMYGDPNVVPWDRWKESEGDFALTADNLAALSRSWRTMSAAQKQQVEKQLKKMYEIEYENAGYVYKSKVTSIDGSGGTMNVRGKVEVTLGNGRTVTVGEFNRELKPGKVTYSAYFAISNIDLANGRAVRRVSDPNRPPYYVYTDDNQEIPEGTVLSRNNGFGTVFNQHAWGWATAAGFEKVEVGAGLEDGPYVWGRVGYRPKTSAEIRQMWDRIDSEIGSFRQGRASIVENEGQARLLEYLSGQASRANHDPRRSPAQLELILALEAHSATQQRKGIVRQWVVRNAPIGGGRIYLADHDWNPADPAAPVSPVRNENLLPGVVQPAPIDPRIGRLSEPGLVAGDFVSPRNIVNGQITTKSQAVRHLASGGSLSDIPNDLWFDAIKANSSTAEVDTNSLFILERPDQPGAIGTTNIFRLRGPDGRATNQGLVFKSSTPVGQGAEQRDDVWAEVAGYNLAATVGLIPDGAVYAGFDSRGRQRVAVPYGRNLGAPGAVLARGQQNYSTRLLETAEEKGLPVRMTHLLHNYFLGAGDRHAGNGGVYVDAERRAYIMPFDHGRIGRTAADQSLSSYTNRNFGMDGQVLAKLEEHARSLNAADRAAFRQKILNNYDEMVDRYRIVLMGGRDYFISRMAIGSGDEFRGQAARNVVADRTARLGAIYDHLNAKVNRAREAREMLEQLL